MISLTIMDNTNQTTPQEPTNNQPPQSPNPIVEPQETTVLPTQNQPVVNKSRKSATMLFIVSFVLAIIAIAVGATFYSTEDGGPARIIGLIAFVFFILSMTSLQRAKQGEQNKLVTSRGTYARNIIIALVLLPFYLYGSYLFLILAWGLPPVAILVVVGFVGLLALVFTRYKLAIMCLSIFFIPCSGFYIYTTISNNRSAKVYEEEKNTKLANLDFQLYAPRNKTGNFIYEKYDFNNYSDPPRVDLSLTTATASIFKRPLYFNPPTDCGQATSYGDGSTKFKCVFVGNSQKGNEVYSYTQAAILKYSPNAKPESYFIDMGSTVISIYYFPKDTTAAEILQIADSLEPITLQELNNLSTQ